MTRLFDAHRHQPRTGPVRCRPRHGQPVSIPALINTHTLARHARDNTLAPILSALITTPRAGRLYPNRSRCPPQRT
ncbi:hypothetical protein OIO89_01125 (plasmid) [Mycobacterium ulcerans]|nr:hypothetical protein OIO89_01125 [Mycobacterium ulcerans]